MLVLLFEKAGVFRPTLPFPLISLCQRFCLLFSGVSSQVIWASDLSRVLTREVMNLPDYSGLIYVS